MKPGREGTIQAQLEMLNILGESGDDYLLLWDFETGRLFLSANISQRYPILQNGASFCTIEDWSAMVYEKDLPGLKQHLEQMLEGKIDVCYMAYRLVDKENDRVWVTCKGRCQRDADGKPVALIGRVSDTVLERKVDQLTGAFNGVKLAEDMERILNAGIPCYLLLMGVDNLKHINIRHGREYGSQILCRIAEILEEVVGTGLRTYRVNGDCFAVNLPELEQEKVEELYQQINARMAEYCTISAGVVSYHGHQNVDSSALYQYVEETLDKAKRQGNNTLAFFSQKDYEEKLSNMELQEELCQSIQDDFTGFSLCYQPQVYSRSHDLFGAEALLR